MQICHIWQNFFPTESGGVERNILNLSNYLSAQDPNIRFLLLTDKSNIPHSKRRQLQKQEKINSIQVHRLGPNLSSYARNASYKVMHRNLKPFDVAFQKSLVNETKTLPEIQKVDVFHLHGVWEPLYASFAVQLSKFYRRPLLFSLHGDSCNPQDPFAMSLNNPQVIQALEYASVITTFSKEIQQFLIRLGLGKKTFLVPNYVNTQSFVNPVPGSGRTGKRVVMVSRLDEHKDPLSVIRAFYEAKKIVPDATLQIRGYGPLYDSVIQLIGELGLEESVKIVGQTPDLKNFLWAGDIFIATKSSYVACLEAWAAGLAVIAPRYGVLGELICDGYNGLLVDPGRPDQLSAALLALLQNPSLRKTVSANGKKQVVEDHDIQRVSERIRGLYDSLGQSR